VIRGMFEVTTAMTALLSDAIALRGAQTAGSTAMATGQASDLHS
jgi:hypothetical protein